VISIGTAESHDCAGHGCCGSNLVFPSDGHAQIRVSRWPTDRPFLILNALHARWQTAHPGDTEPLDLFSRGYWYDYEWHGDSYRLWSQGPDGKNQTADNIVLESGRVASPHRRYVSRQQSS